MTHWVNCSLPLLRAKEIVSDSFLHLQVTDPELKLGSEIKKTKQNRADFFVSCDWKVQGIYWVQVRHDMSAKTMMTLSLSIFFWDKDGLSNCKLAFYQYKRYQQLQSTFHKVLASVIELAGPYCSESCEAESGNRLNGHHRVMCPSLTQGPRMGCPALPKEYWPNGHGSSWENQRLLSRSGGGRQG